MASLPQEGAMPVRGTMYLLHVYFRVPPQGGGRRADPLRGDPGGQSGQRTGGSRGVLPPVSGRTGEHSDPGRTWVMVGLYLATLGTSTLQYHYPS